MKKLKLYHQCKKEVLPLLHPWIFKHERVHVWCEMLFLIFLRFTWPLNIYIFLKKNKACFPHYILRISDWGFFQVLVIINWDSTDQSIYFIYNPCQNLFYPFVLLFLFFIWFYCFSFPFTKWENHERKANDHETEKYIPCVKNKKIKR